MSDYPEPSEWQVALTHRCPRCGEGSLYRNILTIREECSECGLSFREHDIGDGPAFFTITLLGFVVVGGMVAVEEIWRPDYWAHAVFVLAAMAVLTPLSLRFFKSYLIALKYKLHNMDPSP